MRIHHRRTHVMGLRILIAAAAAGAVGIACGGSGGEPSATTNEALGTCGPGLMPTESGGCTACSVTTPGSATDYYLDSLFTELHLGTTFDSNNAPEYSYYQISNGVGTFVPPQPSVILPITIPTPPSQTISLPGFSANNTNVVITGIPSIVVTWGAWTVGPTGVTLQATMNGTVDAHATYFTPPFGTPQIGADLNVNIGQLPLTITFNTDSSGNATLSASGVQITNFTNYVSVSGCSVLGISCDSLADGFVGDAQGPLQSSIASQLSTALNGQNNATPFWKTLMTVLANKGELLDTNNTSYTLPAQGVSSAAGTVRGWVFQSMDTITTPSVTGNFTSSGICYVGCTPLTVAQACASQQCGTSYDGCGNVVQCPNDCPTGDICNDNLCVAPGGCDPACPTGYTCKIPPGGTYGTCVKPTQCNFATGKCP